MTAPRMGWKRTARAVLTDVQFWVPAVVLLFGVILLIVLP